MLGTVNVPGAPSSELAKLRAEVEKVVADAQNNPGGCDVTITFDDAFAGQEFSITDAAGSLIYSGIVPEELKTTILLQDCNATYTLQSATSDGTVYTSIITTGPYFGQYSALCSTFSATISVSTLPRATVTVTGAGGNFTSVADDLGVAIVAVGKAGVYEVTASLHGVRSSTSTVNVVNDGGAYETEVTFVRAIVSAPYGSTVTIYDGEHSYTAVCEGESVTFLLPNSGTWTVRAELNDEIATAEVFCGKDVTEVELIYTKVFGVVWNYGNPSTALTRLSTISDPNGWVNVDITEEPVAAVGVGAGHSPFDQHAPWKGIFECNIIDGSIVKKGEAGFSRTMSDSMVYIPEFYYKIMDDADNKRRYMYISSGPFNSFDKHPGSDKYVGRYTSSADHNSRSGVVSVTDTIDDARDKAETNGFGWGLFDFATWCAIGLLYVVEYADWDSQSTVGAGNVSSSTVKPNGHTDAMIYHTGRESGEETASCVQYRWIENLWGNLRQFVDGIFNYNRTLYVCTTPVLYGKENKSSHIQIDRPNYEDDFPTSLLLLEEHPWLFLSSCGGGSSSTYIPDMCDNSGSTSSDEDYIAVGGDAKTGESCGLYCYQMTDLISSSKNAGSRIMYHP